MTPEERAGEITGRWEHIVATTLHGEIADAIRDAYARGIEDALNAAEKFRGMDTTGPMYAAIRALKPENKDIP
jgi:hypothetical protein